MIQTGEPADFGVALVMTNAGMKAPPGSVIHDLNKAAADAVHKSLLCVSMNHNISGFLNRDWSFLFYLFDYVKAFDISQYYTVR